MFTALLAYPIAPAGIVRAEALRALRACTSDCKLHVILQFTYDADVMIYNRLMITFID